MTKQWFKSKTLWFNVLTGLVFVATYFFGYTPNDALTYNLAQVVTSPLFVAAVNFTLRLLTKKELTLAPDEIPVIEGLP